MKNILIFILFCFALACKKKQFDEETGFYIHGKATAYLNGVEWKAKAGAGKSAYGCVDTCRIFILLEHYNSNGELRAQISMNHLRVEEGRVSFNYVYPSWERVTNKFTYYTFGSDGDVITGAYYITKTDASNFIKITKLDAKNGDVEGNFEANTVIGYISTKSGYRRDTIMIKNGTFKTRINWK